MKIKADNADADCRLGEPAPRNADTVWHHDLEKIPGGERCLECGAVWRNGAPRRRTALKASGALEHGLGDRPEYQRIASDAENHAYDSPDAVGGCEINVVHGVLHPETEERTTAQKSSPAAKGDADGQ